MPCTCSLVRRPCRYGAVRQGRSCVLWLAALTTARIESASVTSSNVTAVRTGETRGAASERRPAGLRAAVAFAQRATQPSMGGHMAVEQEPGPTNQPATRGQDEQDCGYLLLPEKVVLASNTPNWFGLTWQGRWESIDGAAFATWQQNFYKWVQPSLAVFIDSKLFFRMEPMGDENRLGPGEDVLFEPTNGTASFSAYALSDCQNTVMYVVDVSKSDCEHRIYNRFGEMVARSRRSDHPSSRDQVIFEDETDTPIAVAQSPMIVDTTAHAYGIPKPNTNWEAGRPEPWQVWFFTGATSDRGLRIAQNRWVIAAALQYCAIRDATPSVSDSSISGNLWIVGFIARVIYVSSPLVILLAGLCSLHIWFFPPSSRKPKRNIFFRDDSGDADAPDYGTSAADNAASYGPAYGSTNRGEAEVGQQGYTYPPTYGAGSASAAPPLLYENRRGSD